MRPAIIFVTLILALFILESAHTRTRRRCLDCPKHERSRRKGRKEGRKKPKRDNLDVSGVPGLRDSELSAEKMRYLKELAKSHPFLFQNNFVPRVVNKYPINHYTEAVVDAIVKQGGRSLNLFQVVGKFGYHSRHQTLSGRLVHVLDNGQNGSHYGCSEDIANKAAIQSDSSPWIAMMARGKCTFLVKIKLAERFNASAVVVYDTDTNREVEVMRTIGTRVPSLMIDSKGGNRLSSLASNGLPVYLNISVGAINIKTSEENTSHMTKTKARVIVDIQTRVKNFHPASLHKTTGYFGLNSPQKPVSGKLIHIKDNEDEESHFGCSGSILNEDEVSNLEEDWIALIARGKCNSVIKVKLAEKYAASAVVIYDTNSDEKEETINVVGANITALSIDVIDGGKALQLLKESSDIYVDIRSDSSQGESSVGHGSANSLRSPPFSVIIALIVIIKATI